MGLCSKETTQKKERNTPEIPKESEEEKIAKEEEEETTQTKRARLEALGLLHIRREGRTPGGRSEEEERREEKASLTIQIENDCLVKQKEKKS